MRWNFKQHSKNEAVVDDTGIRLTYEELEVVCNELEEHIENRSLVFVLGDNTLGNLIGYVGLLSANCVPAMLKCDLPSIQVQELLEQYQPRYLWVPEDKSRGYIEYTPIYGCYNYVLLKKNMETTDVKLHSELALLLTTSGSTGSPKFVRQSTKNILSNAQSIISYLEINENEKAITTLPMNYTYGLSIINSHLLAGATILLTNKTIMQKEFWNFFKEEGATSFGGVPYTYEMLKKLRMMRMELPTLKTMTQAGGKLLPTLHKEFAEYAQETNRQFIVMYGQCEATARMAYLPANQSLSKNGSMGIAIPGGVLKLIDVNGVEITDTFVTGELVYYGDNVTLGYAENIEDLAKGDERFGELQTGDMAQIDEDGYFYIVGRKKRFLKIFGNRVNLDEVERLLKNEFPDVECACGGKDDQLCIFTTDEVVGVDMKKYIVKATGLNSIAFKVKYVDEIPKNEAGKTLYSQLEI